MKRFIIQESEKENHFVVTDCENKVVVVFENKKFDETQKIVNLEDVPSDKMLKLATINREIGTWLMKNHRGKLY
jgi:hypothetical protein